MRYKVSHNPSSQLISEISAPLIKGIYEPWNQFLVLQIFFGAVIFFRPARSNLQNLPSDLQYLALQKAYLYLAFLDILHSANLFRVRKTIILILISSFFQETTSEQSNWTLLSKQSFQLNKSGREP